MTITMTGTRGLARRVLLVGGSLNQTRMMHRIAGALHGCECWFSPFYATGMLGRAADAGLLDFSILGGQARLQTLTYFLEHDLPLDVGGTRGPYDLAVLGTDLVVPGNLRATPTVLVQEGMMDPEGLTYRLVRTLRLPRVLANTAAAGLSHAYRNFCVASEGFRDLVVRKGVAPDKVIVTGIPNFDNCEALTENDFPHTGYVLAATSCLRETFKPENRKAFIRSAQRVADGRPLYFKLHPNERKDRARREIEHYAPEAVVFADGNTDHMIANCEALVTRYSSVALVAAALGKEVHSDLDPDTLRRLTPVQNGGTSAVHIAEVCRWHLN